MTECSYEKGIEDCSLEEWEESENGLCIFHEPKPDKPKDKFLAALIEEHRADKFKSTEWLTLRPSFVGYHFPRNCCNFVEILKRLEIDTEKAIEEQCQFRHCVFEDKAIFDGLEFEKPPNFTGALFKDWAVFRNVIFHEGYEDMISEDYENEYMAPNEVWRIGGKKISFESADFESDVLFTYAEYNKAIPDFENARFKYSGEQERYCNIARQKWEKEGDREKADIHFKQEMRAKRRQKVPKLILSDWKLDWWKSWKNWLKVPRKLASGRLVKFLNRDGVLSNFYSYIYKFFSLAIDATTSFGTSWIKILGSWLLIILGYGIAYAPYNGIQFVGSNAKAVGIVESLYFSLVTFTTLGIGDIKPTTNTWRIVAGSESVLGGVLMAAFVLVLGRKFMR